MLDFFISNEPWIWLGLVIVFIVIEATTMALTTIWAAIAAVPMIFISKTPLPLKWQFLIFIVATIVLVVFTRPFAVKKLHLGKDKMNVNSMIGQEVLVVKKITQFERGEAKAKNGVIWTVKLADGEMCEEIEENTICVVAKVDGNSLEVVKK